MNLTIYIDVLFLLNLILNYFTLTSTALFCGVKIKNSKLLLSSALGAIYNVIIFFPVIEFLNLVVIKLIMSMILIYIAFPVNNLFSFAKKALIYYIISAIYGGGIYLFYSLTVLGSKMNYSNGVFYISLPLWAIIILSFVFFFIIKLMIYISNDRKTCKGISTIEIYFESSKIIANALLDTGNTLYDPLSLMPVILTEANLYKDKMNSGIYNEIIKEKSGSLPIIHELYPRMKFRIIPFKDVSGKRTCIFAFKPTKIIFSDNKKEIPNMLVGIINCKLSADESYNALLHSDTRGEI